MSSETSTKAVSRSEYARKVQVNIRLSPEAKAKLDALAAGLEATTEVRLNGLSLTLKRSSEVTPIKLATALLLDAIDKAYDSLKDTPLKNPGGDSVLLPSLLEDVT
jgi:hypothetical protein|tara:strand:+ start:191 stop:508 length:318 start_codon:yes stop_codon:yes gene_type:complete